MKKGKKPLFTIGIFEYEANGLEFDLEIKLSEAGNHLDEEMLADMCYIARPAAGIV